MKIAVLGNESSWNELTAGNEDVYWIRIENIPSFFDVADADAFFNLSADAAMQDYSKFVKPVFINSVSKTLKEVNAGKNIIRINGWNGFIKRNNWELAGDINETHAALFAILKKKVIVTPDEPGFISARVISMIINEAFFAKAENVSTEDEIDIAMKLGTNYPLGPFEWARGIGLKNIFELLTYLSKDDSRYKPAAMLAAQAKEQ